MEGTVQEMMAVVSVTSVDLRLTDIGAAGPCTVTVAVLVAEKLLVSVRAAVQRNWTVVEAVDSVPLIRLT
jgi:hypothetical protein